MSPELFIVWLQGYLAAAGDSLSPEQLIVVKAELATVQLRGPYRKMPVQPAQG